MQQTSYWFPAMRYGWGWGLPRTWQGWLALVAYLVLIGLAGIVFPPRQALPAFLACATVLTVLLLAICVAKGEPPAWRWGK